MSLKTAAKYIESQGRGKDSRLMHVSPRELKGLQDLAMAKGGSLSINPNTGLPEAGFLEDVLPIAAAGAMMYFAPQAAPFIGEGLGLGTGALSTGVGMGLLAGGASAAGQLLTTGNVDLGQTLKSGIIGGASGAAMQGLMGGAAPTSDVSTLTPAAATYVPSGGDPYMQAPASYIPSGGPAPPAPPANAVGAPIVQNNLTNPAASYTPPPVSPNSFAYNAQGEMVPSNVPASITGSTNQLSGTTTPPINPVDPKTGLSGNQMLATGLGGVAALSLLGNANQPKIQTPPSTSYIRPYSYSQTLNPLRGQPGQPYYVQKMTAQPTYQAAEGGLMSIGRQTTMYPGSQQLPSQYATPLQMPISSSALDASYEPMTDSYSGQMMAEGGEAQSNPVSQNVLDYNKLMVDRATQEYINSPQLAAFSAAPKPAETPEAPVYDKGVAGLYQYYLGRKPAESELAQYNMDPNVMATPEQANYFNQFTGGELAQSKYKPIGPDPFAAQASPAGLMGAPQYVFNPITKQYVPSVSQQMPMYSPPANLRQMDQGAGAKGGLMPYNLGGYSDGGRLLKGPGDGMSDNIPASIGNKQPARLADGEFVIPADVVSHLGNGSTDAGAKKLYAMMDKVRNARTGNKSQGKQIKADKYLKT